MHINKHIHAGLSLEEYPSKGHTHFTHSKAFQSQSDLIGQFGNKKNRKASVLNQKLQFFSSMFQEQHYFWKTWQSRTHSFASWCYIKTFRKVTSIYYMSNNDIVDPTMSTFHGTTHDQGMTYWVEFIFCLGLPFVNGIVIFIKLIVSLDC